MLKLLGDAQEPLRSQALTLFAARAGALEQGELFVVGRAVNGGDISFKISELSNGPLPTQLLDRLCAESMPQGQDPLGWVGRDWGARERYNTRRSQFWRVVRAVTLARVPGASPKDWFSRIVWTNLYKVSPHAAGNPSRDLMKAQRPACFELLSLELQYWSPRRILFLTGLSWATSFLTHLGCHVRHVRESPWVEGVATMGGAEIVIAPHPQGKPQAALVRDILEHFQPSMTDTARNGASNCT